MSASAPKMYTACTRRVLFLPEKTAVGQAETTGNVYSEPTISAQTSFNLQFSDTEEYMGMGATNLQQFETANHNATFSASGYVRAFGMFGFILGSVLGSTSSGATDTITGSGGSPAGAPWLHTMLMGNLGPRCQSLTVWHDLGRGAADGDYLELLSTTFNSLKISHTTGSAVTWDAQAMAHLPLLNGDTNVPCTGGALQTFALPPGTPKLTIDSSVATPGAPIMNPRFSLINFIGSSGTNYTCPIVGTELTLSRPATGVENALQLNFNDFTSESLSVEGTVSFIYQGSLTGTVLQDFIHNQSLGSQLHPYTFTYRTAATGNFDSVQLKMWPVTLRQFDIQEGKEASKVTCTFKVNNDAQSLINGAPSILQPVITSYATAQPANFIQA